MIDGNTVAAIVPHFNTPQWLGKCLGSLLNQSRKPDLIVVIDDCSVVSPDEVLENFPTVTLLKTEENCGPFRILDTVISRIESGIIMFQDADDWSDSYRLENLLEAMADQELDMVGSFINNFVESGAHEPEPVIYEYPYKYLVENPIIHPIFYASAIINRDFFLKLGGFASGLRFGADSEFVRRAIIAGKVVNLPKKLYFRRLHEGSLTHHVETGFGSEARKNVQQMLQNAARSLINQVKMGITPDLNPILKAPSIRLKHLCGPEIL